MMRATLYSLFMPPEDCFGDFGLLCGFTATRHVLEQITRVFSSETSRPVLAAFIHPTVDAASDVPGLAWMWMRLKARGYNLLHAKVALLGFRRRNDDGYVIRLAVSTGNWTRDPLTESIDLFWSIDVDETKPDRQDCADLQAAWSMFNWLREKADCALLDREYDGRIPDRLLADVMRRLPQSDVRPRFIDSREQPLFDQVVDRLTGTRRNCLIVGSGYYEATNEGVDSVPERLHQALIARKALVRNAWLDLFLNPLSCQGLQEKALSLKNKGWNLRRPVSSMHSRDASLHAKFVVLASEGREARGRIYLGSGNLSRIGFELSAKAGGNLEAGVVFDLPGGLPWNGREGLNQLLPIAFDNEVELEELHSGKDFERPEEPSALPEVAYLLWGDGTLSAPDDKQIPVLGSDQSTVVTPCDWPAPAPRIVTLADGGWRLPVLSDGVFVTARPSRMTIEDVLAGLAAFPEPAERDQQSDGLFGDELTSESAVVADVLPQTYAIRRMMELLVRLSEAQSRVHPRDWLRWCRELRSNLIAITEQEKEMIEFFCRSSANPLPVLADPRLRPDGSDPKPLEDTLSSIATEWGVAACTSLWAEDVA